MCWSGLTGTWESSTEKPAVENCRETDWELSTALESTHWDRHQTGSCLLLGPVIHFFWL